MNSRHPSPLLDVSPVALPGSHAGATTRSPARSPCDEAQLERAFTLTLDKLYLAFQPIVSWRERRAVACEVLMRSKEPSLPNPLAVLDAAERLGRLADLGRRVRDLAASSLPDIPEDIRLFVNIHPFDITDAELYTADAPLSRVAPRVTLEVTERAGLGDPSSLRLQLARLRELGYRIAIDDLGAGYAGLTSLALLGPEVVKLDMSLVRHVDTNPTTARIISSMVDLCRDMGVALVSEGVETRAERDRLVGLGVDLLQGYYFARPTPILTQPAPETLEA